MTTTEDRALKAAAMQAAYKIGGVDALYALVPPVRLPEQTWRWLEEATIAAMVNGWEIICIDGEADYQGWGCLLLHDPSANQWATLPWSYGSCGGCDPYEDSADPVADLAGLIELHADDVKARMAFDGAKGW